MKCLVGDPFMSSVDVKRLGRVQLSLLAVAVRPGKGRLRDHWTSREAKPVDVDLVPGKSLKPKGANARTKKMHGVTTRRVMAGSSFGSEWFLYCNRRIYRRYVYMYIMF